MKHLLLTTIAAVLVVGCGESQQSAPAPEAIPVEPVAEVATPEPPTAKAPDISIHEAAMRGNIEAVKQHLAAGTDVNSMRGGGTPLHFAAGNGHKEIAELFIAAGADVNAKNNLGGTPLHEAAASGHKEIVEVLVTKGADVNANIGGWTPLHLAVDEGHTETADLLRKHGGKTGEELKAEGK
jgi:ankyrin repeat protein